MRSKPIACAFLIALICFAFVLLIEKINRARDTVMVNVSRTGMFNVLELMTIYHERHGQFPRAISEEGGYPHSWRTQVENNMRSLCKDEMYVLTEPWDSQANLRLASKSVPYGGFDIMMRNRRITGVLPTSFFVVTGEETAFPEGRSTGIVDIADGIENTVLVIEVAGSQVPWTQPTDIPFYELRMLYDGRHRFSLNPHSHGPGLLFADMKRYFMIKKPPFDIFAALFTKSGGESWTRAHLIEEGFIVPMSE